MWQTAVQNELNRDNTTIDTYEMINGARPRIMGNSRQTEEQQQQYVRIQYQVFLLVCARGET